jgi:flagellar hook-associated protein 2
MSAVSSSSTSSLAMSGLASGINWTAIINDMAAAEEAPETQWESEQSTLQSQNSAYKTIGTDLTTLNNDLTTLKDPSFFLTRTTASSDSDVASATAATGTPVGTYSFTVSKLATDAVQQGATVSAQPISSTDDLSGVTLSDAALADPITAGTFTVNGQTITISASDTLQSVLSQIGTATANAGAVTASYDSSTDEITLSSSSAIVLGSATDTSNFLQAAQLYTNGTDTITSSSALGAVNLDSAASSANLSTAINDGGNGQGAFEINGVTINFDASTDSINDILQDINSSGAGVTATYDGVNHRFDLTNNTTGNMGMTMQDVTGNFLAATGLSTGSLQTGSNLQYSVNGGSTLTSDSNTIDASSLGLTGLSITALGTGTTNISVSADTSTISSAISTFVNDYNTVQKYIASQTATTTTSSGTTPGTLTGDMDAENIETSLRQLVTASPISGVVQNLSDIGIASNGTDNTLALSSDTLNQALSSNLSQVSQLFTDSTSGLATTLGSYLTDTTGSGGVLATKEQNLTTQYNTLATSITNLQTKITNDENEMQNQFVTMEDAINKINVSKEYLTAYFDDNSSSTTSAPVSQNSSSSSSSDSSDSTGSTSS